jgi:hypothetical protein
MSKFVTVKTELRDLALIKRSLDDLNLHYKENARYKHWFSGKVSQVPLLVEIGDVSFAFRPSAEPKLDSNAGEAYEVVGDDMQMGRIKTTLQKVQQRYAYHKVIEETAKAGFSLVEESTGRDRVIRLTVRRWE